MADEYRIYNYVRTRIGKDGNPQEYKQEIRQKIVKKPKSEYKPRTKYTIIDKTDDETRDEIYREHLRGKTQAEIAEDFGMSTFKIRKIMNTIRAAELAKKEAPI